MLTGQKCVVDRLSYFRSLIVLHISLLRQETNKNFTLQTTLIKRLCKTPKYVQNLGFQCAKYTLNRITPDILNFRFTNFSRLKKENKTLKLHFALLEKIPPHQLMKTPFLT